MCGLAGVALMPGASPDIREKAADIFVRMMHDMQRRGSHACGVGVGGPNSAMSIYKIAAPVRDVTESWLLPRPLKHWRESSSNVLLGHTRSATHGDRAKDECAHPFRYGSVVGAHNGIIYNFRELAEKYKLTVPQVDSEIAFDLLSRDKSNDYEDSLQQLNGYFALTWFDQGSVFMARSPTADLKVAYCKKPGMLLWCSESWPIQQAVKANELELAEMPFEIKTDQVYRFKPQAFDEGGPKVARFSSEFKKASSGKFDGYNPRNSQRGTSRITTSLPASAGKASDSRRWYSWQTDSTESITTPVPSSAIDDDTLWSGGSTKTRLKRLEGLVVSMARKVRAMERELDTIHAWISEANSDRMATPVKPKVKAKVEVKAMLCSVCQKTETDGKAITETPDGKCVHYSCLFPDDISLEAAID